jgi:hypothetical protein
VFFLNVEFNNKEMGCGNSNLDIKVNYKRNVYYLRELMSESNYHLHEKNEFEKCLNSSGKWTVNGKPVSGMDVINNKGRYPRIEKEILLASDDYPIIVKVDSKVTMVDIVFGYETLCKKMMQKNKQIYCYTVTESDLV